MGSNLSAWAIKNPIPTIVLFLVLTLAGLWGFDALRVNHDPDIEQPTVIITITQSGAAPSELETQVARRVEDAVISLGDVDHVRSTLNDGIALISVQFDLDKDIDRAVSDIRDAVTKIRSELPSDINEPIVSRVVVSRGDLLTYAVIAPSMTEQEISWFIDNELSRALISLPGVALVKRAGGVDREIRVDLDPDRLMALGITAADVSRQLRRLNLDRPGGRGTVGDSEQSIRTLGSARSVEDLANVQIILPDERHARLADLGRVSDGSGEERQFARFNSLPVVAFSIQRSIGSSELDVEDRVQERIEELRKAYPNIEIELILSQVAYTRQMFNAALEALILGAMLAVAVVWWFLRDTRATFISAMAIPMSILPTFAVMVLMDFTANNITTIGLALVVGVLVDDAIVEMENIIRHMRMGKRPYAAALTAADEIGMPVVATSLTIVAVFTPVAFVGGIAGAYFFQFGFTIAAAVLFSLLVARMLTPLMSAYLLRYHGETNRDGVLMEKYLALLRAALKHRKTTLAAGIGFFIFSLLLLPLMERDLYPVADHGQSTMTVELPPGATIEDMERLTRQLTSLFMSRPEVADVFVNAGGSDVRQAWIVVNLVPKSERALNQQEFEADMRPALSQIAGARLRFGGGNRDGATRTSFTLVSDDPDALDAAVRDLERQMRTIPGLGNVGSTASLQRPELQIRPIRNLAAQLGVSVDSISTTARIATIGDSSMNLPKFNLPDRQIPIRVQLREDARANMATLENLRVSSIGGPVPLSAVADIKLGSGPAQISRMDRRRVASVETEISGKPLGQVIREVKNLPIFQNLPPGVEEAKQGNSEIIDEVFIGLTVSLIFGILMVYAVLVLLFGSFVHPLTIMTALPLSLGGAILLLLIVGSSMSMPSVIGVLMLMGIVGKNSILLVEYIIVAMEQRGLSRYDAMLDAAHKRARPIVMTTIAMSAGMLPLALKLGADAELRAPMAICVIGGLITSTVLSLVFVPVAFTYMDDLQKWLAPRFKPFIKSAHELPPGHEDKTGAPAE